MAIYVRRDGVLVDKKTGEPLITSGKPPMRFPTPRISTLEPYESPVTGKEITSWRERDRDLKESDSVDARDLPKDHKWIRGREAQKAEAKAMKEGKFDDGFEWR